MSIELIPVEAGWAETDTATLCEGAAGRIRFPVSTWLVLHPRGTVLFDTGLHEDLIRDSSRLGNLAALFDIDMQQSLARQIEAREVDPARIDYIVFSHLHFDHSGGTGSIPNARIVVQADEWAAGHDDQLVEMGVYTPADYDLGHDVVQVRGRHDLFGDGSVVCLPTPGHTAGHQSLRVELDSGPHLLVGDCCYWEQMLADDLLPPFAHDREQQRRSMQTLREIRDQGVTLIYGHDPAQWRAIGGKVLV